MDDIVTELPIGDKAVQAAWSHNFTITRKVHAEVAAGRKTAAELEETVQRQAADLRTLGQTVAELRAQAAANPIARGADSEVEFYRDANGKFRFYGSDSTESGYLPGLLDDMHPRIQWQLDVQREMTLHALGSTILGRPMQLTKRRLAAVMRTAPEVVRKAFDGAAGSGAEFIPEPLLTQLMREVDANAGTLWNLFPFIQVAAQTSYMPVLQDNGRPYLVGSGSGENPANVQRTSMTTAERVLSPVGMGMSYLVHDVSSEDAIFPVLSEAQRSLALALAMGKEDALINGDTSATHQDTGLSSWDADGIWPAGDAGALDHRRAWDGLRRIARAGAAAGYADHSTFGVAQITAGLSALTKPRGRNGGLTIVTSEAAMLKKFSTLDNFIDASKYGSNRPVLAGEVGTLFGARCMVNDFMSEKLASTGFYTGSGATTGWVAFNRDNYRRVLRRDTRIERERSALQQGDYLVATSRDQFKCIKRTSGYVNAFWGYNLS